jgi:hypothetical protein
MNLFDITGDCFDAHATSDPSETAFANALEKS